MKKHLLVSVLCLTALGVLATGCSKKNVQNKSVLMIKSIVTQSQGFKTITVTDSSYDSLFKEGNAREGVKAIIKSGSFYINGFAISAEPSAFSVNGQEWLTFSGGKWNVDRKDYEDYMDAAVALVERIPAGLEMRLYDFDSDGFADEVQADYFDAVTVDSIKNNDGKSFTLLRSDIDSLVKKTEGEGRVYDGSLLTKDGTNTFEINNIQGSIENGDIVLLQETPEGWKVKAAYKATGILTEGIDHEYYRIDETQYKDAMRFSRDNLAISSRCGEFSNALKYFGYMNNSEGLKVSLYLVPTSAEGVYGAPAGFNTDEETARTMLTGAVKQAKTEASKVSSAKAASVQKVIESAEDVLQRECPSDVMLYEMYVLYLAMHGTNDDIGASFAGFSFEAID